MPSPLFDDHGGDDSDRRRLDLPLPAIHPGPPRAEQRLDDPRSRRRSPAGSASSESARNSGARPGSSEATSSGLRSWSSRSPGRAARYDLGAKKEDYERAGVLEYLVVELEPDEVHWFVRRGGRFEELRPGRTASLRSEVFPGLWLDPRALFAGDLDGLIAALDRGLATPEHAAFVARLAAPRRPRAEALDRLAGAAPLQDVEPARQGRVIDGVRDPEVGIAAAEDVAGDDQEVAADRLGDELGGGAPGGAGKA